MKRSIQVKVVACVSDYDIAVIVQHHSFSFSTFQKVERFIQLYSRLYSGNRNVVSAVIEGVLAAGCLQLSSMCLITVIQRMLQILEMVPSDTNVGVLLAVQLRT